MEQKADVQKKNYISMAELNVMEILWTQGKKPASKLYRILENKIGWKKSTSYTVLGKCIEKGFVGRTDPNYVCHAVVSREDVEGRVIDEFVDLYFGGSKMQFLCFFLENIALTPEELENFQDMLEQTNCQADTKTL